MQARKQKGRDLSLLCVTPGRRRLRTRRNCVRGPAICSAVSAENSGRKPEPSVVSGTGGAAAFSFAAKSSPKTNVSASILDAMILLAAPT